MEEKTMRELLIDRYIAETGLTPFAHDGGFAHEFTVWLIATHAMCVNQAVIHIQDRTKSLLVDYYGWPLEDAYAFIDNLKRLLA